MSIVWVDTETTGLNERAGHLLEVALVVTDDDLVERGAISVLCRPVGVEIDDLQMDDYVRQMHTKSGLLDELRACTTRRYEAQAILHAFLQQTASAEELKKTPLGGSTVGFDRAWLREHMPSLEAMFSHRSIDVSSLNELAKRWQPEVYEKRPGKRLLDGTPDAEHRALADIRLSIDTLRYYRGLQFVGANFWGDGVFTDLLKVLTLAKKPIDGPALAALLTQAQMVPLDLYAEMQKLGSNE